MKKPISSYFFTVIGVGLLVIGVYFIKTIEDPQGILRTLLYICVGLGFGIFVHGMGEIIVRLAMKNNPAVAKQLEIVQKDERSLANANRAKAKAFDLMIFVFGALSITVSLMDIDLTVVLLLIFAYLFIIGYCTYYRIKYQKEM